MSSPIDLCTAHTVDFVLDQLSSGSRLLEVGAGNGEVAGQLSKKGLVVTAIDRSEESVQRAEKEGVKVIKTDLFDFEAAPGSFDAILFSRVLHHIEPLDQGLQKVRKLLKPGGVLLLDEFGVELMDLKSCLWFYGLKKVLAESGAFPLSKSEEEIKDRILEKDSLEIWNEHFKKHNVTKSSVMKAELDKQFKLQSAKSVPFLYRYFAERDFRKPDKLVPAVYEWETKLIREKMIHEIGLLWVYRRDIH